MESCFFLDTSTRRKNIFTFTFSTKWQTQTFTNGTQGWILFLKFFQTVEMVPPPEKPPQPQIMNGMVGDATTSTNVVIETTFSPLDISS